MVADLMPRRRLNRRLSERRILAAMDAAAARAAVWGKDDCVLWVADILAPVLGYDPVAAYRGRYKTKRGALRLLGRGGLSRALALIAAERSWRVTPPARANIGDVGLLLIAGVPSIVICRAKGWFVARGDHGFVGLPAGDRRLQICYGVR